jgi:uncharacterized alkaline shock family protein YloU
MDIKEMQTHREALEARLRNVASEIVDEFQRRTGLPVDHVSIDLVDVTTVGGKRESKVAAARLDVRL